MTLCDCGARATYRTSDGDRCGPCFRRDRPDAYAPPLLVIPVAAAELVEQPPAAEPVGPPPVASQPKPPKPYSRKPLPPKPADLEPYPGVVTKCRKCERTIRLKARGLCSACYWHCRTTGTLDTHALPVVPGWQRLAAAESVRVREARRIVAPVAQPDYISPTEPT